LLPPQDAAVPPGGPGAPPPPPPPLPPPPLSYLMYGGPRPGRRWVEGGGAPTPSKGAVPWHCRRSVQRFVHASCPHRPLGRSKRPAERGVEGWQPDTFFFAPHRQTRPGPPRAPPASSSPRSRRRPPTPPCSTMPSTTRPPAPRPLPRSDPPPLPPGGSPLRGTYPPLPGPIGIGIRHRRILFS